MANRNWVRIGAVMWMAAGMLAASMAAGTDTVLKPAAGEKISKEKTPLKLVVGVNDIYCKDSSCACVSHIATREYGDFCRLLKERYQIDLQFVYRVEVYDLKRDYLAGKYDALLCKPWLVFQKPEGRSGQMARIADLQDFKGNSSLWGTMIVPKQSPLKKVSELAGKRVACGQPDAYEKHQGAFALLEKERVKIPADHLIQKASCLECLDLLMKGDVDAAVISNYALTADCAVDTTTPDAWRVIGVTEKIPLTSFMVDLKRVSRADALRIQQALIELSLKQTLPKTMCGGGFIAPVSWNVPREKP